MFIGKFGHLTSTGSTLHKSFFYQERFVNFLNGSRIFSQSRGNGSDTYRTTFKFVYNGAKYLVVYLIQAVLINIQCFQCKLGDLRIDRTGAFHLRKITYPTEQGIGNTGRSAATGSDLRCCTYRTRHIQYGRRTTNDIAQNIIIIVLQMKINTETCTKRSRQQTATCGCTNQRERIQIYLDAACRRSLIDHNIDAVIFHGRIKIFLHHRRQPMNFIDKKYIVRFETG